MRLGIDFCSFLCYNIRMNTTNTLKKNTYKQKKNKKIRSPSTHLTVGEKQKEPKHTSDHFFVLYIYLFLLSSNLSPFKTLGDFMNCYKFKYY